VVFDGAPSALTERVARELYDLEATEVMGGEDLGSEPAGGMPPAGVPVLGSAAAA
jgi:phosphonate transport system ATP-binding protein